MNIVRSVVVSAAAAPFLSTPLLASRSGTMFPSVGRLVVALVVVVLLIYVSVFLFRRFLIRGSGKSAGCIKPMGSLPLGQKARINLVEIGGRVFLLGVTDHHVSMVAEFDHEELIEVPGSSPITSFVKHLGSFSRQGQGAKESSTG